METVVRVVVMYFMVWGAFRVMGKRELTRMSPLELVLLLFIPQLFSRAITRQDYSFTNAVIGATTLLSLVFLSSALSYRFRRVAYVMVPKPTVLVEHGQFVVDALHEERITPRDVYDAMQKSGIVNVSDVEWAVLQSDGSIAIIPASGVKSTATTSESGSEGGPLHGAHRRT
jgi:uncharacterized membrane protein YcaP (DUF421 family)